jgi:spore maturation protein CgeB
MKILLVTETWEREHGPHETLYIYYRQILEAAGHEVRAVDNKKNYLPFGGQTVFDYPRYYRRLRLARLNNEIVNRRVRQMAAAFRPDFILLTKCENIFLSTIQWLKQHTQAVIINWDHDNPFWVSNTSMELLRSLPFYDAFAIWGKFLIPVLYSLGCQRVEFVPMPFVKQRFQTPPVDDSALRCDLAFVGIGSPERAEMLRHLVDFDLGIWGNWDFLPSDDPLRRCVRGRRLDGQHYATVLQTAKIAINVLNMQCRFGSNTRTFEATGCGAFLLTEYTREQAEDLFIEGQEIACFRSAEDLREKVQYYLSHEDERQRIAVAGQARALREHTLEHRLDRLVSVAQAAREGRP